MPQDIQHFFVPYIVIAIGAFLAFLSFLLFAYALNKTNFKWMSPVFGYISTLFLLLAVVYAFFSTGDIVQDIRSIMGRFFLAFLCYMLTFVLTIVSIMIIKGDGTK